MDIKDIIPQKVLDFASAVIDSAQALLQGETALVIGNAGAAAVYLFCKYTGIFPPEPFSDALAQALAGEVALNAILVVIRQFVWSPASVAKLQAQIAALQAK